MSNKIMNKLNSTSFELGEKSNFLEIFTEISKENKKAAVIFENLSISYSDLDILSNKYASYFSNKGICEGSIVGICLERTIDLFPVLLGILKTGACYIPMDPNFPESRLTYMVDDSELSFIFSQKSIAQKVFRNTNVEVLIMEEELSFIEKENGNSLELKISGESIAYIIYTSGSTGKPKGVQIQHKALLNLLLSMKNNPGINDNDKFLALATISFDMSVPELYLSFIAGATIVLATTEMAKDVGTLLDYIDKKNVTIMQATSTSFQMFFDHGWNHTNVRKILCGGEAVSIEVANRLCEICNEVWNMYGPTETTVWSSIYRLKGNYQQPLIGKPIDNTVMIILDENLKPLPRGEVGELYIGGMGLSLGYLNRKELSSERFIKCPDELGLETEKLYKTGDLCRYSADYNIEFVCRADFQVKIRGYRIELGEIESVLLKDPSIHNAVVVAKENVQGQKHLVAYIIPEGNKKISTDNLKGKLSNFLPSYMIPNFYKILDTFPLTLNGKIDRKVLSSFEYDIFEEPSDNRNRFNGLKKEDIPLVKRIEMVLLQQISSINNSFVDLGGDSLSYIKVSLMIEKHLGYLPEGWEKKSFKSLFGLKHHEKSAGLWAIIDVPTLFRAIAITFVIMNHLGFIHLPDASVLFVLSGISFGKFLRPKILQKGKLNSSLKFIFNYGFPVFLWNIVSSIQNHRFWLPDFFLCNTFIQKSGDGQWGFWFLDILTANILLLSVFSLLEFYFRKRRTSNNNDKRFKIDLYLFVVAMVLGVLQNLSGIWNGNLGSSSVGPFPWFWPIAYGAAISSITCRKDRLILSAAMAVPLFFTLIRIPELSTFAYLPLAFYPVMLIIIWVDKIRFPKILKGIVMEIASASLFIYIVHFFFISKLPLLGIPSVWPIQAITGLISGVIFYRIWDYVFTRFSKRIVMYKK